jgi:hypothetical protein
MVAEIEDLVRTKGLTAVIDSSLSPNWEATLSELKTAVRNTGELSLERSEGTACYRECRLAGLARA